MLGLGDEIGSESKVNAPPAEAGVRARFHLPRVPIVVSVIRVDLQTMVRLNFTLVRFGSTRGPFQR